MYVWLYDRAMVGVIFLLVTKQYLQHIYIYIHTHTSVLQTDSSIHRDNISLILDLMILSISFMIKAFYSYDNMIEDYF